MNLIFLSPHFPPQYYRFSSALKDLGVNALGVADVPFDDLKDEVKGAFTEYYRVENMEDYDKLYRAVGFFIHKYGRIDMIESLNEYWLGVEAHLRTDFNIPGINLDNIEEIKLKSRMKESFQKAGVDVVRGERVSDLDSALGFIRKVTFPVIAKPDEGVGASKTYKLSSQDEIERIFVENPGVNYFMEEFVEGEIHSFDGLTDQNGVPVFYTSHIFNSGVMEVVNEGLDMSYYSQRQIPEDLKDAGFKTLKAFDVKGKFFHIEYFRTHKDGRIIGLEVNMRPPGGVTTDMFNYANDIDIYKEWANILLNNEFKSQYSRPYHCCFIGRRTDKNYKHSKEDIESKWADRIMMKGEMPPIFAKVMGDYYYVVRAPELDIIKEITNYTLELA